MATNKLNDIEGIIIKEIKYRNTSKILKMITPDLGKISIMAQAAYRNNSPLSSITGNYSRVRYNLSRGKNFYYIKDGILEENNFFLSKSMELLVISGFISEFIDRTTTDESPERDIYFLLISFLKEIKKNNQFCRAALIAFLLKYSSFAGFKPRLRGCKICKDTNKDLFNFIIDEGGTFCMDCIISGRDAYTLSRDELIFLDRLLHLPMKVSAENFRDYSDRADMKKMMSLALDYNLYNFEIEDLRITKWLDRIDFI
ncbi:MAG: DNA repair protein RecO [Tissierellia bacterium]|nr:DNA repair protein RecO [Tissierellia bacterium]